MENKKSFLLYHDQQELFNALTDEEAGQLIKEIFNYSYTKNTTGKLGKALSIIFIPIKQQLNRDSEKWGKIVSRNRQNIAKRWENKAKSGIPNNTKNTSGKSGIPNALDNDNDNDNDNDINIPVDKQRESSNDIKIRKRPEPDKQTLHERIIFHLEDTLNTKIVNWAKQSTAIKKMLQAGYTEEQIKYSIKHMASDEFYQDKGFDLMTVSNEIARIKASVRKGVTANESTKTY